MAQIEHSLSLPDPPRTTQAIKNKSCQNRCLLSSVAQWKNSIAGYFSLHKRQSDPSSEALLLEKSKIDPSQNVGNSNWYRSESQRGTVFYLAYGSNLAHETFQGRRGIRPLSQINVVVPELKLTFDLPGIPYAEPCFANTALRNPDDEQQLKRGYHKDRWHKGLVGVVYEVTREDFAHIIATEGGGASYQDVLVACYPLLSQSTVPMHPETKPFDAHTLFAPIQDDPPKSMDKGSFRRPDSSYAQPSARYLKLLTDGADEHSLPTEYKDYLHQIRPYSITTRRQTAGRYLFISVWLPFFLLLIALQRKFQDKDGRSPKWLAWLAGTLVISVWGSYDKAFRPVFGDGERSLPDGGGNVYQTKNETFTVDLEAKMSENTLGS